jgi:hypothetical protein
MLRRMVEMQFELSNGGNEPFASWLMREHRAGTSLRAIADKVQAITGTPVSHESVRQWLVEG